MLWGVCLGLLRRIRCLYGFGDLVGGRGMNNVLDIQNMFP
jgi:hypothetical protein